MLFRHPLGNVALCVLLVAATATAVVRADAEGQAAAAHAMLRGTVVDSAGGALPGVALTLINVAEGTQRQTQTSRDGAFAFVMLAPGRYTLRADHVNFAPAEIRDLDLTESIPISITISLPLARMRETVAVRGEISSLTGGVAAVGTVIDRQAMDRVPANGQSVQSLIAFLPGVVNASGVMDATGDASVNGQRASANYYMVDGVSGNIANAVNAPSRTSQASGGALPGVTTLGTTASLTPYEALEEVRVQTSSYAAEYGRQPGAQISLVTRAGDSTWRGSFSTHLRSEAFNANDWFANRASRSRLPLRQQQFGGMLGGPLAWPGSGSGTGTDRGRADDRTFFLIAHEHVRLRSPGMLVTSVPTMALRAQANAGLRPLLAAFPLPDDPSATGASTTLVGDDAAQYGVDTTSVRVDHRLSTALAVVARLNVAPSSSDSWKQTNLATQHHERLAARTLTLAATHQSGRMATDFRVNLSANRGDVEESPTDHLGAIPVPRASLIPVAGLADGLSRAAIEFPFLDSTGPVPSVNLSSSSTDQRQINIVGTTTVALEPHRLKFGVDLRQLQTSLRPRNYDLYLGVLNVSSVSAQGLAIVGSLSARPTELWPRFTNLSLFAQDTWIASPRLTLDAGVRWELNPPPSEAHHQLPYTTLDSGGTPVVVAPSGTPLWHTSARNLGPRLGAAWLLRESSSHETLLRLGGGLFYDLGNTQATTGYDGYHYRTSSTIAVLSPVPPSPVIASAAGTSPINARLYAFDQDLKLPYTGQWNLSIEQALGATRRLIVSYVGAGGRYQLVQLYRAVNVVAPPSDVMPGLYVTTNDGMSDYHALQTQFQQRLSSGFQMTVAHTWSHAIDRTSVESRAEAPSTMARADADFDVRHVFTATVGYDLPTLTRLPPLGQALLRHWSVDGRALLQTGRPLNVILDTSYDAQGMEQTIWATRVPGVPLYVDAPEAPGGRRINADAFQTVGTPGDANRNLARGPGAWQVDVALHRTFELAGATRLTLQLNAFNALNHPNFGGIDQRLSSPTFGEARAMLGRTLGGVNPSYQIGGPRTLELSLRIAF